MYGAAERVLGAALQDRRDRALVATNLWILAAPASAPPSPRPATPSTPARTPPPAPPPWLSPDERAYVSRLAQQLAG